MLTFPQGWFFLEIPRGQSVPLPLFRLLATAPYLVLGLCFSILKVHHSSVCLPFHDSSRDCDFWSPFVTSRWHQAPPDSPELTFFSWSYLQSPFCCTGEQCKFRERGCGWIWGPIIQLVTVPNHRKEYILMRPRFAFFFFFSISILLLCPANHSLS